MVIYTDFLVPKSAAAITLGWIILIRPSQRYNAGLLAHERVHVEQFKRTWGLFCIRYLCSKKYRFQYEVEAYKKQLSFAYSYDAAVQQYASLLFYNYNLDITLAEAIDALYQ